MTHLQRTHAPVRGRLLVLGRGSSEIVELLKAVAPPLDLVVVTSEIGSPPESPWDQIQRAEVVVVDITDASPNTMYELGLAAALNKRLVLVTADDEHIAQLSLPVLRLGNTARANRTRRLTAALAAALQAPSLEMDLTPLEGWDSSPFHDHGIVTEVAANRATVRATNGFSGVLLAADFTWSRLVKDLRRFIKLGDQLEGIFFTDSRGGHRFSITALEENPWPHVAREFPLGSTFQGRVHSWIPDIGLFVVLDRGINGLVPRSTLKAEEFIVGEEVLVKAVRIDEQQRVVELRLARESDLDAPIADVSVGQWRSGDIAEAQVVHVSPRRDYLLVDMPDGATAMLHTSEMSVGLRESLGDVAVGDRLSVRVRSVDGVRGRVLVSDLSRSLRNPADETTVNAMAHRERSVEDLRLESEFLDAVVAIEPYLFVAERRPKGRWPIGVPPNLTNDEIDALDRWYTLYREELARVWRTRNLVVHGRISDSDDLRDALATGRELARLASDLRQAALNGGAST